MTAPEFVAALLWAFFGTLAAHHDITARRARIMRLRLQLAALEAGLPPFVSAHQEEYLNA